MGQSALCREQAWVNMWLCRQQARVNMCCTGDRHGSNAAWVTDTCHYAAREIGTWVKMQRGKQAWVGLLHRSGTWVDMLHRSQT